ncbi:hypothetical protein DN412_37405 [Cupriavidus lacunae]|uniref:EF-hand domain-containing protein n=2 Tax=Cupriavidus lacunae TaxID=2666307 RepID=A0A370NIG5_9BURK|nr:hypothetical protein DN412_37405 [Cupriavidus lacunae]
MPMTRRTFIVSSLAVPAVAAAQSPLAPWSDPDDLAGLRFAEDSTGITITRPPSNKRRLKEKPPADDPRFKGISWRIDRLALGPDATFRLKVAKVGRTTNYVLEASHVRLGNLGKAWHRFTFEKVNDAWRIQMVTNLWTGGETSALSLKSAHRTFEDLARTGLADLGAVCDEPAPLPDCNQAPVDAPFVFSCDGHLVHQAIGQLFEGHLIVQDPLTLEFNPHGVWYLSGGTRGALIANALNAKLQVIVCAWCRQVKKPESDGGESGDTLSESSAASAKGSNAIPSGKKGQRAQRGQSSDQGDRGANDPVFHASAIVDTHAKPHSLTLGSSPSMAIAATDCVTWRYTRRTWRNVPNAWETGSARLASDWNLTLFAKGNVLLGELATRNAVLEVWRATGNALEMSFTGELDTEEMMAHSPMGRIQVRGARDATGSRPPVLILARGPAANAAVPRMKIASIALDLLLLRADLALTDAEYSELRFAPTELKAIYHPDLGIAKASLATLPSYLWLDAHSDPAPLPLARVDLTNARLQVLRSRDLMSLSFLFSGLRFDVFKGKVLLVDTNAGCPILLHADPDDRQDRQRWLWPNVRDTRPVLVAEFPPQHMFEECVFRPDPPALPDVLPKQPTINIPRKVLSSDLGVGPDDTLTVPTEGQAFVDFIKGYSVQDRVVIRRALAKSKVDQERSAGQSPGKKVSFGDFAAAFEIGHTSPDPAARASGASAALAASATVSASSASGPVARPDALPPKPLACSLHDCSLHADLPADQRIYIGPYGMDPDAAAWARRLNLCLQATAVKARVIDMLTLANDLIDGLRTDKQASPANAQGFADRLSGFLTYAREWIKGNKDLNSTAAQSDEEKTRWLERVAEATIPSYQDFRDFYRLEMTRLYFDADYRNIYANRTRYEPKSGADWKPEDAPTNTSAAQIEYVSESGVKADKVRAAARRESVIDRYVDVVTQRTELPARARARLANPSRLAFHMDCAPPRDAHANQSDDRGNWFKSPLPVGASSTHRPFELSTLTDWSNYRMSVCPRAIEVPRFTESGALVREGQVSAKPATDRAKKRKGAQNNAVKSADAKKDASANDQSNAAVDMLRLLQMRSSPTLTAAERLADVEAALKIAPTPLETAVELPARLILSPSQSAVWRTPASKLDWVPSKSHTAPNLVLHQAVPLWTAELLAAYPNPGLRAVYSPDLRPGFVRGALQGRADSNMAPAAVSGPNAPPPRLHTPANLAPPRGPRAPWTLGIEDADPKTSSIALLRNATGATGDVECPPGTTAKPAPPVPDASSTDPASAPDNVMRYPLLDYLCDRKDYKENKETGYGADGIFRTSLDAYDRHELVVLSSAWGLPVRGRREQSGLLQQSQVSSQVELPPEWRPIDIEQSSATYQPRALQLQELRLSALGGTLRHETDFVPPVSARHIAYGPLFDALSIERWQHWTVLGRDVHAEVVYKGFLFPIGHRASLVKQTERVFLRRKDCERVRAWLRQRMFIRISEPDKLFPARGHPNAGRQFPPKLVHMLTQTTPDIVDPTEDSMNPVAANPSPAGRLFVDEPGLVFWPRTARIEGTDVLFDMMFDTAVTQAPLIFVDNVAANRNALLQRLIAYYNGASGPNLPDGIRSPDNFDASDDHARIDIPLVDQKVHLRTLDFGGQAVRYCDETKPGRSSHKTICWTLKASGGASIVPAKNDPNASNFEGRNIYFDDPTLAAADQPPFYPMMETARIRLDQVERIVNGGQQLAVVQFDGFYVANGFPSVGPKDTAEDKGGDATQTAAAPPYLDSREIYLNIVNDVSFSAGTSGDRTGAVMHPNMPLAGLSRTCGPLGGARGRSSDGSRKPGMLFSIAKNYTIPRKPAPAPAHALAFPQHVARVAFDNGNAGTAGNNDEAKAAMKQVFANFFNDDTKLLGVVTLKDLASYLVADVASEYLPKLRDTVEYTLAGMQATSDSVNTLVVGPLRDIVRVQRQKWLDVADRLKVPGSEGTPLAISVRDVFPDVDSALSDLLAALIDANEAGKASQSVRMASELAVVYECGRRLVDAIARVMANPLDRVMLRLEQGLKAFLDKLGPDVFDKFKNQKQLEPLIDWLGSVSQVPPPGSADFFQLLPVLMPPLSDARTGFIGLGADRPGPDEANEAIRKARHTLSKYPDKVSAHLTATFNMALNPPLQPAPPPKGPAELARNCWLDMLKEAKATLSDALKDLNDGPNKNPAILAAKQLLNRAAEFVKMLIDNANQQNVIATSGRRDIALLRLYALLRTVDMVRELREGRLDPFQGITRFTQEVLPLFVPVDAFALPSLKDAGRDIADRLGDLSKQLQTWRNETGGKFKLSDDGCSRCEGVPDLPEATGDSPGVLTESFRELLSKLDAKLKELGASQDLKALPDLKSQVDAVERSIHSSLCDLECALRLWSYGLDQIGSIDWKAPLNAKSEAEALASLQLEPISVTISQASSAMQMAVGSAYDAIDRLAALSTDAANKLLSKALFDAANAVLKKALSLLKDVNESVCNSAIDLVNATRPNAAKKDTIAQVQGRNANAIQAASDALDKCQTLDDLKNNKSLRIDLIVISLSGTPEQFAAQVAIGMLPNRLIEQMMLYRDNVLASASEIVHKFSTTMAFQLFSKAARGGLQPLDPSVTTIYKTLYDYRNDTWRKLSGTNLALNATGLLVAPDEPPNYYPSPKDKGPLPYAPSETTDQLARDLQSLDNLQFVLSPTDPLPEPAFRYVVGLLQGWQNGSATPLRIAQQLKSLSIEALRSQLLAMFDFGAMRDAIESQIKLLVPSRMTTSFDFAA